MNRPPRAQPVEITGPAGRLEALLEEPEGADLSRFGVICHPHPLHGGTLNNKVVHTLARGLHDLGVPTVRFNYRGVGASAGRYDGGIGETEDALAVVAWARERWPAATPCLLGFSFGGVVAIRAAARAAAGLLITVAPAVGRRIDPAVRGEEMPVGDELPACPWLIVQGDADEVLDAGSVLDWASRRAPSASVQVLRGAGHFFHGRLPELREAVAAFANESSGAIHNDTRGARVGPRGSGGEGSDSPSNESGAQPAG